MTSPKTAQAAVIDYMAERYNADLDEGDVKAITSGRAVYDGKNYWFGLEHENGKLLCVYETGGCLFEEKR
jgi:hypothetical protein